MLMYILNNLCQNSSFLTALLIFKSVVCIICILVPILFMFRVFVPFFRSVITSQNVKEHLPSIFKSFVAGLIVFLIPSFFQFLFVDFLGTDDHVISTCFVNASLDKINYYKELEAEERKAALEEEKKEKEAAMQERLEEERAKNEEIYKQRLEKERQEALENGGSTTNSISSGKKTIHIGDSRTVGMCASITGDWSNCQFSNGGAMYNGDDIYIAQGSMGYSWFVSTAVPAVNSILKSNPDVHYNIVSYMGVNYLLSDIQQYIPKYNELASGAWAGHNIVVVSVNPVNESIEAQHGYSTKNSDIQSFNSQLKNGIDTSKIKYCDVYNQIVGSFSTSDGLHYSSSTYQNIYDLAKGCL